MDQTKNLFQLQTELIQMKVDMAVNLTVRDVVEQIANLRQEMLTEISGVKNEIHGLRNEMNNRFSSLDNRVVAIETKLGMVQAKRKGWSDRFADHFFNTGWAWLSLVFSYLILHLK